MPPFHPPSGDLFAMHGKEKAEGGNKADLWVVRVLECGMCFIAT